MTQAWIENLADDIKQKNRDAAQDYGRAQHFAGVVAERGKGYFVALVSCLQENVDALRLAGFRAIPLPPTPPSRPSSRTR